MEIDQNWTKRILLKYKKNLTDPHFILALVSAFALLVAALFVNYYAGTYANERASNPVTDLILNAVPVFYIEGVFVYGSVIFWIFTSCLLAIDPKHIPFTVKCIALFVLIRALFISLTHIGPFPIEAIVPTHNLIAKFTFGGDLFFSGHTGLPFLLALVFWEKKTLRTFFVMTSLFFGAVVLLAHLHYSIDVLSAFFITYTIYHLGLFFFKGDKEIFNRTDA